MDLFEYVHATSTKEAIGMLGSSWDAAAVLAGGTDLISLMKEHVMTPKRVVNIKGIAELAGISDSTGGLRIGALTTIEELRASADVHAGFPALAEAAGGISSPQMRNMGTVGGDLCQRPRCWYFRNGFGLLATDESGNALVPGGENRYHAIFGNDGPAYFVSASSLGPAFVALGAKIHIQGPSGTRTVDAKDFFVTPKSASDREIALQPNEILTHIVVPASSRGMRSATYEVRQKLAMDWPLAAASVAVRVEAGKITAANVVLGHVAPLPWHAEAASKWLVGQTLNESTAAKAGEAAVEGAKPLSQNGYKVQLAKVAVKRALIAAMHGNQSAAAKGGA
jgi:xanthine dehydrogenase YagS FAD-binding subunit